jgi:tRNA pseudouridine38-40 synthase
VKKRYFIYISYKGTAYHGWQCQPNGISVQEVLIKTLSSILRTDINLVGAGRTDAGVHAKCMVAHFDYEGEKIDTSKFLLHLNSFLPSDIAVYKIVEVRPTAHARFDAVSRRYEYHVIFHKDVFKRELATRLFAELDFETMNKASALLCHYEDFGSFCKLHTDVKTNICHIDFAFWKQVEDEWVFTIQADRFLRNMVRAIVGTLFEVGKGKMSLAEFCSVIEAGNRCKAGMSAPAEGLYLVDIQYPDYIFKLS